MSPRAWMVRGTLALVAAVVTNVLLGFLAGRHDVVLVTLAVVCVVACLGLVVDGAAELTAVDWSVEQLADARPQRPEATLSGHERLLERHWASREVDAGLQRRLLALAEHRLAQVHGLHRDTDAAAVRARLGPELVALEDRVPRRLSPSQIARLIDRIEEL